MGHIWLIIALLIVYILFGDARAHEDIYISPETAAALSYTKWPRWTDIEPADTRIRILWIDQKYVPFVNAGSEVCSHQINTFLMKKPYKYDVWVGVPGYPQVTYENVRCFNLYDDAKLYGVLQSSHVIMSHGVAMRNNAMYLARISGLPFVGWAHTNTYVRAAKKPWNDPRLQGRQFTVFNSESLLSTADVPSETSTIVKPPVDFRNYAVEPEKHQRKYVTLSNVNGNKGGHLLIQLAKSLPDIQFLGVIGGYKKQITQTGLPNLTYLPNTKDIKSVYAQTWVQIMPSAEETWGRTAVEAMSSGIPVVVSPTPGLKECCDTAAIYCDRSDLESWVTTIRKLKDDTEFYNRRSTAALERARALDPHPDLDQFERWLDEKVIPTKVAGRMPTWLEKNMVFR